MQVPSLSSVAKREADNLFIKVIISARLAFNIMENEEVCAFIHHFCPAYKIPTRYEVSPFLSVCTRTSKLSARGEEQLARMPVSFQRVSKNLPP